jgi:hypothetical protein
MESPYLLRNFLIKLLESNFSLLIINYTLKMSSDIIPQFFLKFYFNKYI